MQKPRCRIFVHESSECWRWQLPYQPQRASANLEHYLKATDANSEGQYAEHSHLRAEETRLLAEVITSAPFLDQREIVRGLTHEITIDGSTMHGEIAFYALPRLEMASTNEEGPAEGADVLSSLAPYTLRVRNPVAGFRNH